MNGGTKPMKKLLAILLALMMVLVSVAALAADDPADTNGNDQGTTAPAGNTGTDVKVSIAAPSASAGTPTKAVDVEINKIITPTVVEEADKHPELKLRFTVGTGTPTLSTETTAPAVSIPSFTIDEGAGSGKMTIKLPSYKAVGVYTYPITEDIIDDSDPDDVKVLDIAGMTEANKLELKVTVIQDVQNNQLVIGGIAIRQDDVKVDKITNLYKSGDLSVTKTVDGIMGDRTKSFPITITLQASTGKTVASTVSYIGGNVTTAQNATFDATGKAVIEVQLKHGETVTIHNIPEGVTYKVEEDSSIIHVSAADVQPENVNAYYVTGEVKNAAEITVGSNTPITITNTKTIDVDTGVSLDSTVYMLIMALALVGFVVLKVRRREDY